MTNLILVGAGASHGSDDSAVCPPLGNQLFNALVACGGIAACLPAEVQSKFRVRFEEGMDAFEEWGRGDVTRFQRELGVYLAGFRPGPNNVYIELLKGLHPERVIFCSLNYDLLLEGAANAVELGLDYGSVYAPGYLRILKIHGSSNFWPDVMKGIRGMKMWGSPIDLSAPVIAVPQDEALRRGRADDSFSPAIALYSVGKRVKMCPGFVAAQLQQWQEQVAQAERIAVVGTAVYDADEHIWGSLAKSPASIHYFAATQGDKEAFLGWCEKVGRHDRCEMANFKQAVPHLHRLMG